MIQNLFLSITDTFFRNLTKEIQNCNIEAMVVNKTHNYIFIDVCI